MATETVEKLISDAAFQEMASRAKKRRFGKGAVILNEGEAAESIFFMLQGSVSIRRTDESGVEILLAYRYAGDFFGEMALFPGVDSRSAMVQARDEVLALEVTYRDFVELTKKHARLWLELAGQLAERLRSTNQRLAMFPLLHAAERVWGVVAEIASHGTVAPGGEIPLRVTRSEVGKLAACSRELAGMVLKDLESTGRVRLHGQTIFVRQEALAAGSPGKTG